MRDEIFDREYQAGRDALNDGIDRGVQAIGRFFSAAGRFIRTNGRAIHAFEFDAPWQKVEPAKRATAVKRARAA